MQNQNIKIIAIFILLSGIVPFSSCKKFVEIPPPINQIVSPLPFANDATATGAVIGIYSEMMRSLNLFSSNCTTLYAGMAADELYFYSPSIRDEFIKNQITEANHNNLTSFFWQPAYKFIYTANLCIEQLNISTALTLQVKNMLIGESKFIRAFCYFHLINLFGDVPLTTTSDYRNNANLPRTSKGNVFAQIISDLKDAQALLTPAYPSVDRVRPNKWTVTALLARVYLYTQDWINAEAQATDVIGSGTYTLESDINSVFLKTSREAIWQLRPVNPIYNTYEGNAILPGTSTSSPTYLLTNTLLSAFEIGDLRRSGWVASRLFASQTVYYPFKYKIYGNSSPLTEYYTVLRLAEQYLIRAEARAHLNNFTGTKADLNIIRSRAGLLNTTANTQISLLSAIEQERRIEFFTEWGHRWYDLKRTGRGDAVLGALKPATWQTTDALWPIPQNQINLNPALTQNAGY